MKKPARGQLENDLKVIDTALKGRGVDAKVNIATMKKVTSKSYNFPELQ